MPIVRSGSLACLAMFMMMLTACGGSSSNNLVVTQPNPSPTATPILSTIRSIQLIGQATFPTQSQTVQGTTIGGLSGITYDASNNRYLALTDDRGTSPNEPGQPPRFYSLNLDFRDNVFDSSRVTFTGVTTLRRLDGSVFAPLSTDLEGIALRGNTVMIVSEGEETAPGTIRVNPFVREFITSSGQQNRDFSVPTKFLPDANTAALATRGVRNNLAFESATITPDQRLFFTATEGALMQDGSVATLSTSSLARILRYDLTTNLPTQEYLYEVDRVAESPVPSTGFAVSGLVDLLALNNEGTTLLSLERSFSAGAPGTGNTIKLYEISLDGATDVSRLESLQNQSGLQSVRKRLILNLNSLNLPTGLDNVEGLTLGPTLPNGQRALVLISDDNFSPPGGVAFTQILVFGVN